MRLQEEDHDMSTERAITPLVQLDAPIVSATEAKEMWVQYQALEQSVLDEGDYMWFLEFEEQDQRGRTRVRRYTYRNKAAAVAAQKGRAGSIVLKRKVKSACRKLAKFFGYEIPSQGTGDVETRTEGEYTLIIERGEFYSHTEWLGEGLRTVKASTTVFLRSPHGRTWMGKGGAHMSEGFEDFAIGETSFTRAVNRAVLDAVGYGDSSAEEMAASEPVPGAPPPEAQKRTRTPRHDAAITRVREIVQRDKLSPEHMSALIANNFQGGKRLGELTEEEVLALERLLSPIQGSATPTEVEPDPDLFPPEEEPPEDRPVVVDANTGRLYDATTGAEIEQEEAERDEGEEAPPPDEEPAQEPQGATTAAEVHALAKELGYPPARIPTILGSRDNRMTLTDYLNAGHSHEDAAQRIREYHQMGGK